MKHHQGNKKKKVHTTLGTNMKFVSQKRKVPWGGTTPGEGPPAKKFFINGKFEKRKVAPTPFNKNKAVLAVTNGHNGVSENSVRSTRACLPVYEVRDSLLKALKITQTNILVGETGSGKTTQVPQLLYEDSLLMTGAALVTQPRRVAAISVAKRVAQELGVELGGLVGYSVRFEDVTSGATKLKFCTDGMVLREAMLDPLLKRYSWLILDEAHERTVNTDILFGVVKAAQRRRKEIGKRPLHIIIMSATMNAHEFSEYFDNCPVLEAPGREHALGVHYLDKTPDDYVYTCMKTVMTIHKKAPLNQGILVFLTGQEEIESAVRAMRKVMEKVDKTFIPAMKVVALYGALAQNIQMSALKRPSENERHVIFSTNIAETSLTIPGVKYVVDSGKAKIRSYCPSKGVHELKVRNISQAQARQRAGRAGREADGFCYRTYSQEHFESLGEMPTPEILSTCLAGVALQLLTIGVTNVHKFDFIDKPNKINLTAAIDELVLLEAVKRLEGEELELTELGKKMSRFPLSPKHSKIIIMGEKFKCTQEVLTIIAMLNSEQALVTPSVKKAIARNAHQRFFSMEGDHITLLNIYRGFNTFKRSKSWCHENFVNFRSLTNAAAIRKQLSEVCERCNVQLVATSEQTMDDVKRCLLSGLLTQVAELQPGNKYTTLSSREPAKIHPSSGCFESRSGYVLYTELVNNGVESYMHQVSRLDPEWIYEAAPNYFRNKAVHAKKVLGQMPGCQR